MSSVFKHRNELLNSLENVEALGALWAWILGGGDSVASGYLSGVLAPAQGPFCHLSHLCLSPHWAPQYPHPHCWCFWRKLWWIPVAGTGARRDDHTLYSLPKCRWRGCVGLCFLDSYRILSPPCTQPCTCVFWESSLVTAWLCQSVHLGASWEQGHHWLSHYFYKQLDDNGWFSSCGLLFLMFISCKGLQFGNTDS